MRSTGQRFLMLLGVIAIQAIALGIGISAFFPESARQASGADYWGPLGEAAAYAGLCLLGVHLVVFAFVARFVSYRWFDALFLLVPIVSVIFWFRVVWRLTALPERYWPARDEELPAYPRRPVTESAPEESARVWQ